MSRGRHTFAPNRQLNAGPRSLFLEMVGKGGGANFQKNSKNLTTFFDLSQNRLKKTVFLQNCQRRRYINFFEKKTDQKGCF